MSKGKIAAIIILAILVSIVAVIFWPAKVDSRHNLNINENIKIVGDVNFYIDSMGNDFDFEIVEIEDITRIIDYFCNIKCIRSFKKVETPLLYSDHRYSFRLFNTQTGESKYIRFNGRYIEISKDSKTLKYRIFPKDIEIAIIDRMIAPFIVEGMAGPSTPIKFTDESDHIIDMSNLKDGWVEVEWLDAHSGKEFYATFNGLKPYSNLEIYENGSRLIIFYDEGEGEKTDTTLKLDHLPSKAGDPDAMIIFILNGERSYNAKLTYGRE